MKNNSKMKIKHLKSYANLYNLALKFQFEEYGFIDDDLYISTIHDNSNIYFNQVKDMDIYDGYIVEEDLEYLNSVCGEAVWNQLSLF